MDSPRPRPRRTGVAACTGDGALRYSSREIAAPTGFEVVLALRCCGFCGTDLFKIVNRTVAEGEVLGHELVGTVVDKGPNVAHFALGDRVVAPHHVACGACALCRRGSRTLCSVFKENLMAPGGFSEHILLRERVVTQGARLIPDHISDEAAAFLEPAACVLRGVTKAEIAEPGGLALIIGGGSMGLLHLLVLRSSMPGLKTLVVDPLAERRRLAETLGADASCSPATTAATVEDLSDGLGADAIFDTVGGSAVLCSALANARPGGTVVLFAHAAEGEAAGFELNPFFKNERRVVATYSGSIEEQDRIAELLFSGALDPTSLVTHRVPLDRADEAVRLAREQRALKIMIGPPQQGRGES